MNAQARACRAGRHWGLATVAATALLTACHGPQNYLGPAGPGARELAHLGWLGLILFSIAAAVIWVLLAWIVMRRRGSFDEHAPADSGGGQRWIVIGGIVIPVVVLTITLIASLRTLSDYPMAHAQMEEPDIRVVGHQWWFDAMYLPGGSICATDAGDLGLQTVRRPAGERAELIVHSPSEIHIPVGRPVEIELLTRDVIHSFWVPKLHGKVDLIPGQANRIRIQADLPGVYQGQCAEYCGVEHANMRLQVVAQSAEDYVHWLNRQRGDASSASSGDEAAAGRKVFESAACALCHTVRGTDAHGQVGPELTHVGSRRRIAGGMFDNNTANLAAWVTHAQSLKPGSQMPDLTQFTGRQLRALVAYLQSLK
jgi:cytochrome c oxidase subunit 2